MITQQEGLQILLDTVRYEIKHPNYQRSIELAEFSRSIVTGEGEEKLVDGINERESPAQRLNRIKIYRSLCRYAVSQIKSFVRRVRRIDNVKQEIKGGNRIEILEGKVKHFHGRKSLIDRLYDLFEHYLFLDSCAFLVVDRQNVIELVDGELKVTDVCPYIIEVSSKEAINYEKIAGEYKYLIFEQKKEEIEIDPKTQKIKKVEISHFYLYAKGFVISLKEYVKQKPEIDEDDETEEREYVEIKAAGRKKPRTFVGEIIENGSTVSPIVSVGVYTDDKMGADCFVSIIEPAREVFVDLINEKSELDVLNFLHAFPQKIAFAPDCQDEHPEHGACQNGCYGGVDEYVCSSCKGTGVDLHTSQQDVILVKFPEDKTNYIPLKDLVAYVDMPSWLPPFKAQQLDVTIKRISLAIFNTEVFQNPVVNKTATETIYEDEKVNVKFLPYATAISNAFTRVVEIMAGYLEVDLESAVYEIDKDFKLSNLTERLQRYKLAKDAGLSNISLWGFERDVIAKQHWGNPMLVKDIEAFTLMKPFRDKAPEEIAMILSSRAEDDYDRLLWENFDRILTEVHTELTEAGLSFHLMPLEVRRQILRIKIEELQTKIKYKQAVEMEIEPLNLLDFEDDDETGETEETDDQETE